MNELQICANSCPKAVVGEPCAHCPLIEAQRDAEREDEAFEVQQTLNACRSTQLIKDLEQSIAETDLVLFFWVGLLLIIAVMLAFGQSPVRMCGGV